MSRPVPRLLAAAAARGYALIVRLYPAEFRRACEAPMLSTFEEVCRTRAGYARFARECAADYGDALAGAWRARRRSTRAAGVGGARHRHVPAFVQEARHAVRRLVAQPSLVLFTVLTLGFAIAANAGLFTIVDAVLVRPSPFTAADRLVNVLNLSPRRFTYPGLSRQKLQYWRTERTIFEAVEAYRPHSVVVTGGAEPEEIHAAQVSPGLLATLGVAPRAGRLFADAAESRVVLLGEGYWRSHFGGDPAAIGRALVVNGVPHTIVGVMPDRFHFPTLAEQIWTPLDPDAAPGPGERAANTLVRLRQGLTVASAQARVDAAVARLTVERPLPGGWGIVLDPGTLGGADERTRRAVIVLAGAVGLLLLTACANAANVLLSRALDRRREFAIRLVLGAGRARLMRELVIEGLLLGLLAGVTGLLAARWAVDTLVRLAPESLLSATATSIAVDGRVVMFGLCLAIVTGIACNLPPAIRAMQPDGTDALTGRSRTAAATPLQRRTRAALVTVEVALSVMLIVGAALLLRSFVRLRAIDVGFDPRDVLAVTIGLDPKRYDSEPARLALLTAVAADIRRLPGVQDVAIATGMPPSPGTMSYAAFETERGPCLSEPAVIVTSQVTPGFFRVLGIPLVEGRALRDDDPPDAVVVSRAIATRCGGALAGRRLRLGPGAVWLQVVGVAADVKTRGLTDADGELAAYLRFDAPAHALPNQADRIDRRLLSRRVIVRADRPAQMIPHVKRLLWALDPNQPVLDASLADDLMADSIRRERFVLALMSLFAAVALALASAGIFGALAYSVAQRTPEIGIRLALGATAANVRALVLGQGLALAAAGSAAGLAAAYLLSHLLASLLYEIDARDPVVFAAVPTGVLLLAALAAWVPTTRALKIDPASALRVD